MKQLLSYFSPPPARGVPWVCKLCRRCLFLLKTTHGHQVDQQPTSKVGQHVEKYLRVYGSNLQRPHLPKQSNKSKLQSRFPSGPIGQFLAFLLPPTCIGAVPWDSTTKRVVRRTIELPQSTGKLGKDTHLRLGVDRLFDIGHGRTNLKGNEEKQKSHHFTSFYTQPVFC